MNSNNVNTQKYLRLRVCVKNLTSPSDKAHIELSMQWYLRYVNTVHQ